MGAGEQTVGTENKYRNLVSVLHDALEGAEACAGYALNAEMAGNERLAGFFREVQSMHAKVAGRTEEMLGARNAGTRPAGVRPSSNSKEGDPGDVSPGQEVT